MTQTSQANKLTHLISRRKTLTFARIIQVYAGWQQRKQLRTLDDDRLRDIGLTRSQADAEAARPIWNAPDQWLR